MRSHVQALHEVQGRYNVKVPDSPQKFNQRVPTQSSWLLEADMMTPRQTQSSILAKGLYGHLENKPPICRRKHAI